MYCTLRKIEGLWHSLGPTLGKTACEKQILPEAESITIGQGNPRCQPDPPIDTMCPICFKSHPHFLKKS